MKGFAILPEKREKYYSSTLISLHVLSLLSYMETDLYLFHQTSQASNKSSRDVSAVRISVFSTSNDEGVHGGLDGLGRKRCGLVVRKEERTDMQRPRKRHAENANKNQNTGLMI